MTENQEQESRRRFGKIMPLRQLLQRCLCPSSIDNRRFLGSIGLVEREGLLPGQQLVFYAPCPGDVAPLERTLQGYPIVSCRESDADEKLWPSSSLMLICFICNVSS